ncbi:MAG: hypothetical protein ACLFUB_06150 [Cyclobacteriaceae bacterium]
MKRFTSVRQYLLMVSKSYARGWETSVRLFEEEQKSKAQHKFQGSH